MVPSEYSRVVVSVAARTTGMLAINRQAMARMIVIFFWIHERFIIHSIPVMLLFKTLCKKQLMKRKWHHFKKYQRIRYSPIGISGDFWIRSTSFSGNT